MRTIHLLAMIKNRDGSLRSLRAMICLLNRNLPRLQDTVCGNYGKYHVIVAVTVSSTALACVKSAAMSGHDCCSCSFPKAEGVHVDGQGILSLGQKSMLSCLYPKYCMSSSEWPGHSSDFVEQEGNYTIIIRVILHVDLLWE